MRNEFAQRPSFTARENPDSLPEIIRPAHDSLVPRHPSIYRWPQLLSSWNAAAPQLGTWSQAIELVTRTLEPMLIGTSSAHRAPMMGGIG